MSGRNPVKRKSAFIQLHLVISKTHLLVSQLQALDTRCLDSLGKVLREKLSLLVKVVASALWFL